MNTIPLYLVRLSALPSAARRRVVYYLDGGVIHDERARERARLAYLAATGRASAP